ncbi:Fructokinase [Rubrivivax sp. A210]|uniref:ROK family protein n=1 Tax=Rubrivivax sp. A210 TaxID=2772301 RepID=UPI00191896F4|nr:ROK family protein [Rubrivivax sp. A210]CAD5372026.1 Fructokinase [Rubrivivax sp. A210]
MAGAPLALGVDLGGTKIAAALLDEDGRTLWQARWATPQGDYAATLATVQTAVQAAHQAAEGRPFSIGCGTPGTQTAAGLMKNCNSTCLIGRPLQADLMALLGQPVVLANDANCLALSEATDGAGAGAGVVFAVILGTGAGAGIAVHGRVLSGPNGLAGEWGHNPLPWGTPGEDPPWACYCGQRHCVESYVSGSGLAQDHRHVNGEAIAGEAIVQRAAAGDAACAATLERHARRLARALAAIVNLLDPDVIVLGGGLSRMVHLYERVPAQWGQWVFAAGGHEPVHTQLLASVHGDASGVRGAAWIGRQAARG